MIIRKINVSRLVRVDLVVHPRTIDGVVIILNYKKSNGNDSSTTQEDISKFDYYSKILL